MLYKITEEIFENLCKEYLDKIKKIINELLSYKNYRNFLSGKINLALLGRVYLVLHIWDKDHN